MIKDFSTWIELKEEIHQRQLLPNFYVKEGEVWWCSFGTNVGVEIDGKGVKSFRPIVIIKVFNAEHIWAVPLTGTKIEDNFHFFLPTINNSSAILSHLRTISSKRLFKIMGIISAKELNSLKISISSLLKIETPALSGGILTPSITEGNNDISITE